MKHCKTSQNQVLQSTVNIQQNIPTAELAAEKGVLHLSKVLLLSKGDYGTPEMLQITLQISPAEFHRENNSGSGKIGEGRSPAVAEAARRAMLCMGNGGDDEQGSFCWEQGRSEGQQQAWLRCLPAMPGTSRFKNLLAVA